MWTTSLESLTRSNTAWTRCKRWTNKDKCCAEKWNNGNYSRGHSRQRDKPARVLRQFWGCGFKVNKSPMLLFWIIRLFWKPLHFFILLFFYQTNSKSLRSAWKRSFDVLIKKYTKLQILFYLNFWSEKKKTATTTLTQIFIQVSEDIHVFALVLYQHIPWRKRTTTIFIGTNTMQIDYFQFI